MFGRDYRSLTKAPFRSGVCWDLRIQGQVPPVGLEESLPLSAARSPFVFGVLVFSTTTKTTNFLSELGVKSKAVTHIIYDLSNFEGYPILFVRFCAQNEGLTVSNFFKGVHYEISIFVLSFGYQHSGMQRN
jgi:hypothetical protein